MLQKEDTGRWKAGWPLADPRKASFYHDLVAAPQALGFLELGILIHSVVLLSPLWLDKCSTWSPSPAPVFQRPSSNVLFDTEAHIQAHKYVFKYFDSYFSTVDSHCNSMHLFYSLKHSSKKGSQRNKVDTFSQEWK